MKRICLLLSFVVSTLFVVPSAHAADFNVVCSTSTCSSETLSSFFPSSIVWYPGLTVTKTLHIDNNSSHQIKAIAQNTSTTGDINQVVQFDIVRASDSITLWSGSLYSFYNSGVLTLMQNNTTSADFSFTATMYTTANNSYQGKQTKFDLEMGFEIPSPTLGACAAGKPPAPGGLGLTQQSNTDVKITWSSVSDPVSDYFISWGTNKNADDVGTKSIGKTTETTVSGLNLSAKRYYVKVRAINGCKEGEFSGLQNLGNGPDLFANLNPTATPTPASVLGAQTTQTGQVLGTSTQKEKKENGTSTNSVSKKGKQLGVSTSQKCVDCKWWPLLLFEMVGVIVSILVIRMYFLH